MKLIFSTGVKMMLKITAALLVLGCADTHAQRQNNTWMLGAHLGIDFNQNPPALFSTPLYSVEGCASYSDPVTGALMFYTQGATVWNRDHAVMPNGLAIARVTGNTSVDSFYIHTSAQGTVIAPVIGEPDRFYIFSQEPQAGYPDSAHPGALFYSVVDMSLDGGRGDVLPDKKGIVLDPGALGESVVIAPGSCNDYWVIAHQVDSPLFKSWHITAAGINPQPVISRTAEGVSGLGSYSFITMDVSPNGRMIALSSVNPRGKTAFSHRQMSDSACGLILARFDAVTGRVYDGIKLSADSVYGVGFSYDNTKLYTIREKKITLRDVARQVMQLDIGHCPFEDPSSVSSFVLAIDTVRVEGWSQFKRFDGKLFVTNDGRSRLASPVAAAYLDCILYPDLPGAAAEYRYDYLYAFMQPEARPRLGLPQNVHDRVDPARGVDTVTSFTSYVFCFADSGILNVPCQAGWNMRWEDGTSSAERVVYAPGMYVLRYHTPCSFHIDSIEVVFSGKEPEIGVSNACLDGSSGGIRLVHPYGVNESYDYVWVDETGDTLRRTLGSISGDSLLHVPPKSYTVHYATAQGCRSSVQVQLPYMEYGISEMSVQGGCAGLPLRLESRSAGTFAVWEWDLGDGTLSRDEVPEHQYAASGSYAVSVKATTANGCVAEYAQTIYIDAPDTLRLAADRKEVCVGDEVRLRGTWDAATVTQIAWDFGDGSTSDVPLETYTHVYPEAGSYTVRIRAGYRYCPDAEVQEQVAVAMVPQVDLGPDSSLCPGEAAMEISNLADPGVQPYRLKWSDGSGGDVLYVSYPGGLYWLEVEGPHGCRSRDSIMIWKACDLGIPNVFTPDGDGRNDYFFAHQAVAKGVVRLSIKIFNRWGEMIYSGSGLQGRGWDGSRNGVPQPSGVYIYEVDAVFRNGYREQLRGNISLLR